MAETFQSDGPLIENDLAFQSRMWTVQRCGWIVMAVLIVGALLGLLGPGPLSTVTVATASGKLQLMHDRFVRRHASTNLYVTLSTLGDASGEARLRLNRSYLDRMEVQRVTPTPIEVAASSAGLTYTFRVEGQTQAVMVTFTLQPTEFGSLTGSLSNGRDEVVSVRQFAYP